MSVRKWKDKASRYMQQGKLADALKAFAKLAALDPEDASIWLKMGDIHRRNEDGASAVAAYEEAARRYAAGGFLLKAIAVCKMILTVDPRHESTQAQLAALYAQRGGPPAAAASEVASASEAAPSASPPKGDGERWDDFAAEAPPAPAEVPQIPLFSSLPKPGFVDLVTRLETIRAAPDEVVVRQGDPGDAFFAIAEGGVRIVHQDRAGQSIELAQLGEGDFFGEMAMLQAGRRTASAITRADTTLLVLPRSVLEDVIRQYPEVATALKGFYRDRLLANMMRTHPLFAPFEPSARAELVTRFRSRTFPRGSMLLDEGVRATGLYLLVSGKVRVERGGAAVGQLGPGEVFGEMSLLLNRPTSAKIITESECFVLRMGQADFAEVIMTHPQVLEMISELSKSRTGAAAPAEQWPETGLSSQI